MLSRRALVFIGIVALHVGFVYVLNAGLATQAVEAVFGPIETKMIEEVKDEEDKPPPPPPKIETTPPPFVPPPDITIDLPVETSATTAITATTQKPVAKPPPAPPKVDRVPPRQNKRGLIEPDYPPQSKRLGEEGATVLRLYILEDGRVGEAQVSKSSGFPRLDEAAVKHAKRSWRFQPGTEGGKPVAMWYDFRVVWKIEKER
jgi:protein TonB